MRRLVVIAVAVLVVLLVAGCIAQQIVAEAINMFFGVSPVPASQPTTQPAKKVQPMQEGKSIDTLEQARLRVLERFGVLMLAPGVPCDMVPFESVPLSTGKSMVDIDHGNDTDLGDWARIQQGAG